MSLCLAAGALTATLALNAFTLAWMHSIEKIRWEEDWRIDSGKLVVVAARIRGSGAGMEIPSEAALEHGVWRYQPALPAQVRLHLARSPFATDYELCVNGQCTPLADHLPGIDNSTVVTLGACP